VTFKSFTTVFSDDGAPSSISNAGTASPQFAADSRALLKVQDFLFDMVEVAATEKAKTSFIQNFDIK